jgi:PadR family transcriptional regulator PadR
MTYILQLLLCALLEGPETGMYGAELTRDTGVGAGSVYPALQRLEDAGWLESRWVHESPPPARHYYQLTPSGEQQARAALARVAARLAALGITADAGDLATR